MLHVIEKYTEEKVKDEFDAFLIKDATLTTKEEYPLIEKWMIPNEIPKKIVTFKESKRISKNRRKDYYVCTFEPDSDFKSIKRFPKRYIDYFKQFAGIIGFDYSIHSDQPIVVQKYQMYSNLALSYFFGANGIKVIPNVRTGTGELPNEFFETIPKKCLVAIGTHGFIHFKAQKYDWYYEINQIIEKLNPSGIIVYGSLKGNLYEELKEKVPIHIYDSWIEKRNKKEEI